VSAPDLDEITCEAHGKAYATFVCQHLLKKRRQTWHCEPATDDEPWPSAWCDVCHEAYVAEGEWNDRSEAAANLDEVVQVICHRCYEMLRGGQKVKVATPRAKGSAGERHAPYGRADLDLVYNLLFCDEPALFSAGKDAEPWRSLLAATPDAAALQRIATDAHQESRARALAWQRLRTLGLKVPPKVVLGVVVEVPLDDGLDVLAAYSDGTARYINQSGKLAVFESGPDTVRALARELVEVAQPLVNRIGPWHAPRLSPPPSGVRLSFIASDGLYFGEGSFDALSADPLGGAVLGTAGNLLQAATAAAS
jgi:hypothetical protein